MIDSEYLNQLTFCYLFFLMTVLGLSINVYTQHFLRHTVKFANSYFGSAEFAIRIVAKRQNIASKTDAFQRWEFLRPFGSKRTEFERQIRLNRTVLPNL